MDELEVKKTAINSQILQWKEVRINAEIAERVGRRLKDEALTDSNVKLLIRCETALDELNKMLKEIEIKEN